MLQIFNPIQFSNFQLNNAPERRYHATLPIHLLKQNHALSLKRVNKNFFIYNLNLTYEILKDLSTDRMKNNFQVFIFNIFSLQIFILI